MSHSTSYAARPAAARIPEASAAARAHSGELCEHLAKIIVSAGGWISFARYMQEALYAPGLGYYVAGAAKIGAEGDFITAPLISPLFGQTLGVQVREVCAASAPQVLEFGAGTGHLAAQLLGALGDACASYQILELSPELRARQAITIERLAPAHAHKVSWLDALPDAFEGCVVANEVLDAMPTHLVHYAGGEVYERGVALDAQGGFAWRDQPAQDALLDAVLGLPLTKIARQMPALDYITEVNLVSRAWMSQLANWLTRGSALIIDYGFPESEFYHPQRARGTLMCHTRHHAHDDPFFEPGLTDITSHVDFSATALAAQDAGLAVLGYTTQAQFLLNCGITALMNAGDAAQSRAVNTLVSPAEMGELFKVLAVGRDESALLGFTTGDQCARL